VTPQQTDTGTFTEAALSTEDETTPLTPFWKNSTDFHNSDGSKATTAFGYAYPETQSWNFDSTAKYQQSIIATMTQLYGVTAPAPSDQNFETSRSIENSQKVLPSKTPLNAKIVKRGDVFLPHFDGSDSNDVVAFPSITNQGSVLSVTDDKGHPSSPLSSSTYREWITNIRVQKHSLGGTFQVHVFIGDFSADPDNWLFDEANVGTFSVLGTDQYTESGGRTGCDKCTTDKDRKLIVTGVVHLTEALMSAVAEGLLASMEPEHVEPYLKEKLHWRVIQVNNHKSTALWVETMFFIY
jgi:tyrosinase